jgi:hypothetical protein
MNSERAASRHPLLAPDPEGYFARYQMKVDAIYVTAPVITLWEPERNGGEEGDVMTRRADDL